MSAAMIDLIKQHQPCFGTNQFANTSLQALHEYGNIDKHRRLVVNVIGTGGLVWDPPGPAAFVHDGPVEDGTVLARFPAGFHKASVRSFPTVVFGEGAAQGEDVQRVLGLLRRRVPRIVEQFQTGFF